MDDFFTIDQPTPPSSSNGLPAQSWVAIGAIDPRLAEPLLGTLRSAVIGAYVAPFTSRRSSKHLEMRLWVDAALRAEAERVVVARQQRDRHRDSRRGASIGAHARARPAGRRAASTLVEGFHEEYSVVCRGPVREQPHRRPPACKPALGCRGAPFAATRMTRFTYRAHSPLDRHPCTRYRARNDTRPRLHAQRHCRGACRHRVGDLVLARPTPVRASHRTRDLTDRQHLGHRAPRSASRFRQFHADSQLASCSQRSVH